MPLARGQDRWPVSTRPICSPGAARGGSPTRTTSCTRTAALLQGALTGRSDKDDRMTKRRRRWSPEDKARILAATQEPGAIVAQIARAECVSLSLLYKWRLKAHTPVDSAPTAPLSLPAPDKPVVRRVTFGRQRRRWKSLRSSGRTSWSTSPHEPAVARARSSSACRPAHLTSPETRQDSRPMS